MKVVSGTTVVMQDEFDLSAAERAEGWIFGCCRNAVSDLELEVEDLTGLNFPRARTLPCRIEGVQDLSPNVRRFVLRLPPSSRFFFLPGQYVQIIGPGGVRRSYSLAGTDERRNQVFLHVRQVRGGTLSNYLFGNVQKDDLLRLKGPLGTFVLRDVAGRDLVFLATGTGIAPIIAMLEQVTALTSDALPSSVKVIWGGRVPEDLYLDLHSLYPEVDYIPTLSQVAPEWMGAREYVQDILVASRMDLSNAYVYACGSEKMINDAREKLLAAGLSAKAFFSDAFVPSAPVGQTLKEDNTP